MPPDEVRPPVASGRATTAEQDVTASLRDAAAGYATLGWRVHPCRPGGKDPLTKWGDAATTDPALIAQWWRRWPNANVAVCTGAPGPDVLDVDVKGGARGLDLFERGRRAGLLRGAAAMIRTPSGGLHLWFTGTSQGGGAIHSSPGARDRALELKAVGGYVLVPPSRAGAGEYELIERRDTSGFIDWPRVRALLDPQPVYRPGQRRSAGNAAALAEWVAGQGQGNRNSALFWACCQALDEGCEDLEPIADGGLAAGLPDSEVRATVESARRRKAARS